MIIPNSRFGKLLTISPTNLRKSRRIVWECICDCGNVAYVTSTALVSGNTKSCGCLNTEHNQLESGKSALNRLYRRYLRGASKRNITFCLTIDEFYSIVTQRCFYCGAPPNTIMRDGSKKFNGNIFYTGIDRLDNSSGYVIGNVVPCCSKCNYAKRDMTYDEFISWARKLNEGLIERDIRKALRGMNQPYVPSQTGK